MPEGPEIKCFAENIDSVFSGKYLLGFWREEFSHFRNLEKIQLPNRLRKVYALGKKIIFEFEKGYLLSSLGLEGGWYLGERTQEKPSTLFKSLWAEKINDKIFLTKHFLSYDDTRRFGLLEYFETKEELEKRCEVGIDLLGDEVNYEQWKKAILRGKKSQICLTLMEQKYVAGIGNYLRSDILYSAKIDPKALTGDLTEKELKRLYDTSLKIIKLSYEQGGAKGSYTDLYDRQGNYECLVYGKKVDSKGNKVETFKDKNGRTVWHVPQNE